MKPWKIFSFSFLFLILLFGCSNNNSAEDFTDNENETQESSADLEIEEKNNLDIEDSENQNVFEQVEREETVLILSNAFEEANQNSENNELVALAEDFLTSNPNLGSEDSVTLTYTGYWYEENDQFSGVFLLTNKTGQTLNDFSFAIDWNYDGEIIYDSFLVNYYAESMNILPDHSTILLLLPIENEKQDLVREMESLDNFHLAISDVQVTR